MFHIFTLYIVIINNIKLISILSILIIMAGVEEADLSMKVQCAMCIPFPAKEEKSGETLNQRLSTVKLLTQRNRWKSFDISLSVRQL